MYIEEFGKQVETGKPIAVLATCNYGGVALFDIVYGIDDYVISAIHDGEKYSDYRIDAINYDDETPYFERNGERYNIDEFMRV